MLLFFDIDGTLFDSRRRLPASVLPALEKASGNGHRILVNTGRTLCNMDTRLKDLPIDGWIMGCGTRIIWQGQTLQSMELDPDQSARLRKLFLDMKMPVVYECDTAMYFDPKGTPHPAIPHFAEFSRRHGIYREIRENDPEFRVVKMFGFPDHPSQIQEMEKRTASLGIPYTAVDRGNGGWEIIPSGYTKATGMEVICRLLNAGREDCVAFGDSSNDEAMLRFAGRSVAMGSADETVKKLCTFVTDPPEEDGIARALQALRLI